LILFGFIAFVESLTSPEQDFKFIGPCKPFLFAARASSFELIITSSGDLYFRQSAPQFSFATHQHFYFIGTERFLFINKEKITN
jgi:hypothetical protein